MKKMELNIPQNFFEEKTIYDFTVTEKTKKIWAVELDLLTKLLDVCRKNDIKVIVYAGTMLGAVRHKGFIPWDDDIDVALLREDYEKLLRIADKEFQFPYFFQTALSDRRFFCGSARLRNSNTTGLITYNEALDYNNGIYIDVFALDGLTDNDKDLAEQIEKRLRIQKQIQYIGQQRMVSNPVKKLAGSAVSKIMQMYTSYEKLYAKYSEVLKKYEDSPKVSLITANVDFAHRYCCNRSDLQDIIWVPFEFIRVPIPRNYDKILTNFYGDYHRFPPVEERGAWHSDVLILDPDLPYKEFIRRRMKKCRNN